MATTSGSRTTSGGPGSSSAGGVRHIYEAEIKASRITPGRPGHEAAPTPGA